jgi:cytochrome P450
MTKSSVNGAIPNYPQPRERECPFAPSAEIRALSANNPLNRVRMWDASTPWLVTGPDELRMLLTDPRVSADEHLPGLPQWSEAQKVAAKTRPTTFWTTDGPEHARLRRMLARLFSYKHVNTLRPQIQAYTDLMIDEMLAGPKPVDLVPALALPVPTQMICAILGAPYEDRSIFQRNAEIWLDSRSSVEDSYQAFLALDGYMRHLIAAKHCEPDDSVTSEIAKQIAAGSIDLDDGAFMGTVLVGGGFETTTNMIAMGALAFVQNPEQAAIVRNTDDPAVIANAVEEMLRYVSVAHQSKCRVALEDIEIAGETIHAGDGIVQGYPLANWDAGAFPAPERFDVSRDVDNHIAFGFGPHGCLGQNLARIELQVVYPTLLRRIPSLELAVPVHELEFKHEIRSYGVFSLPVTW